MRASLEFLLGILDAGTAGVAPEDLDGPHGDALRLWQQMGFIGREPMGNPVACCPHCGEGTPYRLGARFLCNQCHGTVEERHLRLWPLRAEAFLAWLAAQLRLRGGVRQIEERLWQLGSLAVGGTASECFFRRSGPLTDAGRARLAAYRSAIVLTGLPISPEAGEGQHRRVFLLELLQPDDALTVGNPASLLRKSGNVRFDRHSGALWVGDALLGEVPVGSKEHAFLACLAGQLDHFVPYADLKRAVLRQNGSADATEEATFCQTLKSRIKRKWIPQIDWLVVTTNKGDGYRLRGALEV